MKKYYLRFQSEPDAKIVYKVFALAENDDKLKEQIECLAMLYEERNDVPFRCVSVGEVKEENKNDLS